MEHTHHQSDTDAAPQAHCCTFPATVEHSEIFIWHQFPAVTCKVRMHRLDGCVCCAGRQKVVRIPPSEMDAKQVVQTLSATADGACAVLHIRDLACLALDVPAAAKADSEVNLWSEAMPGAQLSKQSRLRRSCGATPGTAHTGVARTARR